MHFTILKEIKSTLPKSLFYNYYSQIKSNQMLVFDERGKPEYPGKNLSWQSRGPTNSIHIWQRVRKSNPGHIIGGRQVLSPLGQPCNQGLGKPATPMLVRKNQRWIFRDISAFVLHHSFRKHGGTLQLIRAGCTLLVERFCGSEKIQRTTALLIQSLTVKLNDTFSRQLKR